jgi:hypothetical protein
LKCKLLNPFMQIPKHIWKTPKITAIFIFRELVKVNSSVDAYHTGSSPKGYTQFSLAEMVEEVCSALGVKL